jgi:integrase/recombinase XerD
MVPRQVRRVARGLGIHALRDLSIAILEEYRRHRVQAVNAFGRRDRPQSVNLHLAALRDFLRGLIAKGVVPASLREAATPVKEPKLLPKGALTHREMMKLLERIPGVTAVNLRDRAMLELLYSSGLRRQELVDLKILDVDLDGGVVRVECGKGGKGRVVPLGRAAAEWIRRYLQAARPSLTGRGDDEGWLFVSKSGAKLGGNVIREVVCRWAKAAGITKAVSPHTFRRSCATGMVRNRANLGHVKDLLGQGDFRSLQSYVRLEIADLKEAHRKFHPRERDEGGNDDTAGAVVTK